MWKDEKYFTVNGKFVKRLEPIGLPVNYHAGNHWPLTMEFSSDSGNVPPKANAVLVNWLGSDFLNDNGGVPCMLFKTTIKKANGQLIELDYNPNYEDYWFKREILGQHRGACKAVPYGLPFNVNFGLGESLPIIEGVDAYIMNLGDKANPNEGYLHSTERAIALFCKVEFEK